MASPTTTKKKEKWHKNINKVGWE